MVLSKQAKKRLADVVQLQPTKNKELQERWGIDSGSEIHQYLESELGEYYYRDDNSLIRATEDAAELVDVAPGVEGSEDNDGIPSIIRVPELHVRVFTVLAGPEDRSQSVVSVLNDVREEFDVDPSVEDVRAALQSLRQKDVVTVVYRTVPTFQLATSRDMVDVEQTQQSDIDDAADVNSAHTDVNTHSEPTANTGDTSQHSTLDTDTDAVQSDTLEQIETEFEDVN
ncbi:uncharacterized protein Hqrw_2655 [Haloquadratum walsbyi C23]|uniref:Uncharacterized protein n=1 Tax=Haloquadratum walsbyi (strain DSM 16854 / JCM 12705 / C23) TaxID=768065 RepID=G0LL48_HALWC|nr:uncharacterized protein Hqrw_2655 [Haloquadratum walsbyi C23]